MGRNNINQSSFRCFTPCWAVNWDDSEDHDDDADGWVRLPKAGDDRAAVIAWLRWLWLLLRRRNSQRSC